MVPLNQNREQLHFTPPDPDYDLLIIHPLVPVNRIDAFSLTTIGNGIGSIFYRPHGPQWR